ncbi:MAG: CBS domain-containing protein [Bacillaceae bacterium]|nr:CBS domain-containing protein [Bacillaceae bacterium]
MLVKDIMTKNVTTVSTEDSVETCARLLMEGNYSGIPVTDQNGKLVGIVTEGDLIKRASRIKAPAALELLGGFIYLDSPTKFMEELKQAMANQVAEMMTKHVITIGPEDSVEKAATLLIQKNIKRLPVVEGDLLVGIISRRDIMAYLYPKT